MPETDDLTWEQTPPRRPNIADFNGGQLENDTEFPPSPGDPDALAQNQLEKQMVGVAGLADFARLYVTNAGTPALSAIWCMRTDLVLADFTITDGGTGITDVTHTGGKIPAVQWLAEAYRTGNAGAGSATVESITNGWRVRTYVNTTLTDLSFVLKISGL